jgi:hypothetical protein
MDINHLVRFAKLVCCFVNLKLLDSIYILYTFIYPRTLFVFDTFISSPYIFISYIFFALYGLKRWSYEQNIRNLNILRALLFLLIIININFIIKFTLL